MEIRWNDGGYEFFIDDELWRLKYVTMNEAWLQKWENNWVTMGKIRLNDSLEREFISDREGFLRRLVQTARVYFIDWR